MNTIYQLPVDDTNSSVVELGDGGRRYRKQLVKFGAWVNPNDKSKKMVLDKAWAEKLLANFKSGVLNRVPVVEGHPQNSAELVTRTRGGLQAMSIEADGVYGDIEIKAPETAKNIDGDLIYDVSVSFDPDYVDKATGTNVGPALLHVGLVNDPYLKGMTPFQALSDSANVIMLSESKEYPVSKTVKNEREFPVTITYQEGEETKTVTIEAGAEVEVPEAVAEAATKQVTDAAKPETEDEKTTREAKEAEDKVAADKVIADEAAAAEAAKGKTDAEKLEDANKELSAMKLKEAVRASDSAYQVALSEGKVVPAQADAFKKLHAAAQTATISLSDGGSEPLSEVLADFLKHAPKAIDFSEKGGSGDDDKDKSKTPWEKLSDEERARNRDMQISEQEFNEYNKNESSNSSDSDQNKE